MLLNSHISAYARCLAGKVCGLVRSTWGTSQGKIHNTKVTRRANIPPWYHSRTLGAHVLATVVGPSPTGLQFRHIRYICPVGATQVDHESAQLSRLEAVVVASPKSPESPDITSMASRTQTPAVCLHQRRVPQFALKYPCNPPPPQGGRPSLGDPPPPRGRPREQGRKHRDSRLAKTSDVANLLRTC